MVGKLSVSQVAFSILYFRFRNSYNPHVSDFIFYLISPLLLHNNYPTRIRYALDFFFLNF